MTQRDRGDPLSIGEAIGKAASVLHQSGCPHARLEAEVLLSSLLEAPRWKLYRDWKEPLGREQRLLFTGLLERRKRHEPLQYIMRQKEFWGLMFCVFPGVFIPRPETELLVEEGLTAVKRTGASTVVDLCTGSGCLAVSLARESSSLHVYATDMSPHAVACARLNAERHGVSGRITFLTGDLFVPLRTAATGKVIDLILVNPPYVSDEEWRGLPREIRDYEPAIALCGGADGLDFYRRILPEAADLLTDHGMMIMEMGEHHASRIKDLVSAIPAYSSLEVKKDLAGKDRIAVLHRAQRQAGRPS